MREKGIERLRPLDEVRADMESDNPEKRIKALQYYYANYATDEEKIQISEQLKGEVKEIRSLPNMILNLIGVIICCGILYLFWKVIVWISV